jgi:hypothetical protein
MSMKEHIARLLNLQPRNDFNEMNMKFYKDCLDAVPHGELVVSSKRRGLKNVAIPFVFTGMTEPPVLTARLMAAIESAAESQGYVPHFLITESYGRVDDEAPAQTSLSSLDPFGAGNTLDEASRQRIRGRLDELLDADRVWATGLDAGFPDSTAQRKAVARDPATLVRNLSTGEPLGNDRLGNDYVTTVMTAKKVEVVSRWMRGDQKRNGIYAMLGVQVQPVVFSKLMDCLPVHADAMKEETISKRLAVQFDKAIEEQGLVVIHPGLAIKPLDYAKQTVGEKADGILDALVFEYVPDATMKTLDAQAQDELKALILMTYHNCQQRQDEDAVVSQDLRQAVTGFFDRRGAGEVKLNFPRMNGGSNATLQ